MRPDVLLAISALTLLSTSAAGQPKTILLQSFEGTQLEAETVRLTGKDFSGSAVAIAISRAGPLRIVISGSLGSSRKNFQINVTGIPSKDFNIQKTAIWFPLRRTSQIGIQIPYGEYIADACFAPGQRITKDVTLVFDATQSVVATATDFPNCAIVKTPLKVTKTGKAFLVEAP